jgi:hypothetical protein
MTEKKPTLKKCECCHYGDGYEHGYIDALKAVEKKIENMRMLMK